jgi:hypothetical protein
MFFFNKNINEGKHHLNNLYNSCIGNSCDGDTVLCQNM